MDARKVLRLTQEFESATGQSSEDMGALFTWIASVKGPAVLRAFQLRLTRPI